MLVVRGGGLSSLGKLTINHLRNDIVRVRQGECVLSTFCFACARADALVREKHMFATLHRKSLSLSLGLLLTGASAGAWAASALPAVDAGTAPADQTVHVTLVLKLHHEA